MMRGSERRADGSWTYDGRPYVHANRCRSCAEPGSFGDTGWYPACERRTIKAAGLIAKARKAARNGEAFTMPRVPLGGKA